MKRTARDVPFLRSLPKVELHRHLEGTLRLQTCLELARAARLSLPTDSLDSLRPFFQYTGDTPDFVRFLGYFDVLDRLYDGNPDSVRRVAREAVLDAAADSVRYLELRFNPNHFARRNGADLNDVTRWVTENAQQAADETDVALRFIITVPRHYSLRAAERLVQIAVDQQGAGIRAVDLAGDEVNHSWKPHVSLFHEAQQAGLGLTIHAGEVGPPENVATALTEFRTLRIGHGVQIAGDDRLMDHVRDVGATLEICPTSNLQTGAVRAATGSSAAQPASNHPLPHLYRRGIRVTLNTDDPGISGITLTDEYALANQEMGLRLDELRQIMLNGVAAAFLPDEEKEALGHKLLDEWDA